MASSQVQDLPAATTPLDGTEIVYLKQGGVSSRTTTQDLADLAGGASGDAIVLDVAATGHGFLVGNVLYHNGTNYALAKADSATTSDVVGIVSAVADVNNFTMTMGGKATLSGLTAGQYYLSPATAGLATLTAPTTDGHVFKPLFNATSSTEALVDIQLGILVGAAGAGGTVTDVSVASANGFGGSVATSTSTPDITITTSVMGLLKGNGTGVAAATAGTDYVVPAGNTATSTAALGIKTATTTVAVSSAAAPTSGQVLTATGGSAATWQTPSGGGGPATDLASATTTVNISAAAAPTTGQALIATSGTAATWQSLPGGGDALTSNPLSQFAATTSAQLAGVISDETGSGALVFANSPTLVTPALGTPSALVATNATGTASGLTAGTATVANGIKTATTTVVVSSATAPTTGQVLTATSGTAANWQTPSGGGSSAFNSITSGTNTTAAMVVGSGATLGPTGTGTITANDIGTGTVTSPGTDITISGSGTTASPRSVTTSTALKGSFASLVNRLKLLTKSTSASATQVYSGTWLSAQVTGLAATTQAVTGNRLYLAPVILGQDFTAQNIGLWFGTAVASAEGQFVVYQSDPTTGDPVGTPVFQSASVFPTVANNLYTIACTYAFKGDLQYWWGYLSNSISGNTCRVVAGGGCKPLGRSSGLANNFLTYVFVTSFPTAPDLTAVPPTASDRNLLAPPEISIQVA